MLRIMNITLDADNHRADRIGDQPDQKSAFENESADRRTNDPRRPGGENRAAMRFELPKSELADDQRHDRNRQYSPHMPLPLVRHLSRRTAARQGAPRGPRRHCIAPGGARRPRPVGAS